MRRHYRLLIASIPLVMLLGIAAAGAATAGGGCHGGETLPSEASSNVVKIDGCTFAATVTRVPAGTTVIFENTSFSPHDVTGRMGEWGSKTLEVGARFAHRFSQPGVYPFSCSLHPGMAGVVIAGSPEMSLTSDVEARPMDASAAEGITAAAPTTAATAGGGDATLPILAAGGLGILAGALVTGGLAARRQRLN